MGRLAQGLLMNGDTNYQQEFCLVIVAATFRLRPLNAD